MKRPSDILTSGLNGGKNAVLTVAILGAAWCGVTGGIPMVRLPHFEAAVYGFFIFPIVYGIPSFLAGFVLGILVAILRPDHETARTNDAWPKRSSIHL